MAGEVPALLDTIQSDLLAAATKDRDDRTVDVTAIEDVAAAAADGFVRIPWDSVGVEGEARLANDALTVRCLQRADGSLPEVRRRARPRRPRRPLLLTYQSFWLLEFVAGANTE